MMASATKIAVVYSRRTGRVRWWLVPDHDGQLGEIRVREGENVMHLPIEGYGDLQTIQAAVNAHTKMIPTDDRYAVVHPSGEVVGAILADPLCGDAIEGHRLIQHNHAGQGWKHHAQHGFIPPSEN
jgi:hypothetical protein